MKKTKEPKRDQILYTRVKKWNITWVKRETKRNNFKSISEFLDTVLDFHRLDLPFKKTEEIRKARTAKNARKQRELSRRS